MRCRREGGEAGGQLGQRSEWANQDLQSPASSLQSGRLPTETTLNKEKLVTGGKTLANEDFRRLDRKQQVDEENKYYN